MGLILNELKRKTLHSIGALFLIGAAINFKHALAILGILTFLTFFLSDYYEGRKYYKSQIKRAVHEFELLPKEKREKIMGDIKRFERWEENLFAKIINGGLVRKQERKPFYQMFVFFLAALLCLSFFGKEITILATLTLAIGDAFSTLVGIHIGRSKIIYNKQKSLEGSIAFVISVILVMVVAVYFIPALQILPIWQIILVCAVGGAAIESAPAMNDNLSIPLFVGFILFILTLL